MPATSTEVDETSEGPSGSQNPSSTDSNVRRARRASIEEEVEDESIHTGAPFQPVMVERSSFLQRQPNEDIDHDPDDMESRMPAEKSSLKSSLKVEVNFFWS
jgi:hypothetical protein